MSLPYEGSKVGENMSEDILLIFYKTKSGKNKTIEVTKPKGLDEVTGVQWLNKWTETKLNPCHYWEIKKNG